MTVAITNEAAAATWTDKKRWLWLFSPLLPALSLAFVATGIFWNMPALFWGEPVLMYMVIPLADWLIGTDRTNPPEGAVARLETSFYYQGIIYSYVPIQYAVTILGAWAAVHGGLSAVALIGLLATVSEVNGYGINTAHELGHKKSAFERWLSKITLAPAAYGHFFVEHNRGHHKNVATPIDPASSRMGESFWVFLPRTVFGSLKSAWNLEKERLARKGKSVWSLDNENLQAWSLTVVLFGGLTLAFGWAALPFLIIQAVFGATALEVVNYLEHYGLLRRFDEKTGRYERCTPAHSWNNNNVVTNLFLYQLQRHSDHHAHPTRRFQALRHFEESPQLPSGYIAMGILAVIPPLWFRVMDPLVAAHYKGDLTRANIYEPARERLMAKWHKAVVRDDASTCSAVDDEANATSEPAEGGARHQCPDCGYVYDEAAGCEKEGFPAGTKWEDIPGNWSCPDCAVREKRDFANVV